MNHIYKYFQRIYLQYILINFKYGILIRFETKIDGLSKAITDLSSVVNQHSNYKGDDKVA